jgi:ABC-type multidrug transport system ATPase subunit
VVQVQGRLLPLSHGAILPPAPLAVDDLAVRFGSVTAVDGVRLNVERGQTVGLVGPNGCGKTTTLRVVMGLVEPDRGRVRVAGHTAGSLEARSLAAWLPDEPSGLDELTVGEYLDLVRSLYGAPDGFQRRAETLLDAFAVADRRRRMLGALSHGVRRIVAFVAAAALRPPLLVVDEATAALDPGAVLVLREALRAHARRGGGALVATQDLHFAGETCNRVSLLDHGRVVADGRVDQLLARYSARSLEDVFVTALGREGRLLELRRALDTL